MGSNNFGGDYKEAQEKEMTEIMFIFIIILYLLSCAGVVYLMDLVFDAIGREGKDRKE